ncbi:hypothetical protein R3P38DRAFT_3502114 [Favolaschia claudopus]|uniref:Uncharacterized protein n=1 Tax=Favolaschia claudopus TaxID=2862362 RepID=A0AAV9Z300_9AGAR
MTVDTDDSDDDYEPYATFAPPTRLPAHAAEFIYRPRTSAEIIADTIPPDPTDPVVIATVVVRPDPSRTTTPAARDWTVLRVDCSNRWRTIRRRKQRLRPRYADTCPRAPRIAGAAVAALKIYPSSLRKSLLLYPYPDDPIHPDDVPTNDLPLPLACPCPDDHLTGPRLLSADTPFGWVGSSLALTCAWELPEPDKVLDALAFLAWGSSEDIRRDCLADLPPDLFVFLGVLSMVDTLMKYLLDSLQSYETGHADALCPVQNEVDKSFMGEHLLVKPVTTQEFRATTSEIMAKLNAISLDSSNSQNSHRDRHGSLSTTLSTRSYPTASPPLSPPTQSSPARNASVENISNPNTPSRNSRSLISEQVEVIPGVAIPDLKKGDKAWLEAVRQWEHGDESQNLKALRDWPREWYSDGMRKITGSKRSQRKLIFDEYERLGRNEAEFIKTYPETHKRISKLIGAIRDSNKARGVTIGRRSKRGVGVD